MSAIEHDCKKIRKRKTRAERNQLAKHHHYDVEKQKINHFKSKKTSDHIQSHNPPPTFSLRSNKGASMPCLISKDSITATAGNITQGRLTRPLAVFENARTSTWATRAPETEELSQHKEIESKRSFNVPGLVAGKGNDVCGQETYVNNYHRNTDNQNMEVDSSHLSSPPVSETSSKKAQPPESRSPKTLSYHSPASTNNTVLSENSPVNEEEVLELEPPVQDIADIIMKELKSKFDKYFPKRDITFENCCDLEKLLRQRSRENEMVQIHSISSVHVDKKSLPHSNSRAACFSASTPSVCPPMRMQRGLRQEGSIPDSASPSPLATPQGSERFTSLPHGILVDDSGRLIQAERKDESLSLITNMVEDDKEKVIKIKLDGGDGGDVIECNSPYTSAICDEFFESAQQMKLKLDKQRLMQLNSVFPHSATDENDKRRQLCSLQNEWQSGGTLPLWRRTARTIDFSQPNGSLEQNMFTGSSFFHHKSHSTNPPHHRFHTGHTSSSRSPDTNIFDSDPDTFSSKGAPYCLDRSLRHTLVNPAWSGRHTSTLRMGQSLAQSRFNFQEALNTACRLTDARLTKQICCRGHFEHLPVNHLCSGGCKSLKSQSSYVCCHSPQVSSFSMSQQPLIELQSHQADLQRQAKDFLDDLVDQSPEESRNVFPIGSPESSPVWMPSCIRKDVSLETSYSHV